MDVRDSGILFKSIVRTVECAVAFSILGSAVSAANAATKSLKLEVSGYVSAACSVDTLEYSDHLDLGTVPVRSQAAAMEGSLLFNINCNTPFDYTVKSRHGQLVHDGNVTIAPGSDSFSTAIPYRVKLSMELDDASTSTDVDDECTSENMQLSNVCISGSSGSLIAINKTGTLNVSVDNIHNASMLSGNYSDTLKLTVFPRH